MTCPCSLPHHPHHPGPSPVVHSEFHGGPHHLSQAPAHMPCCAVPCHKPLFIPNQPPVHHHHGCCAVPPPPQKGPWEYTPSHLYPDPFHIINPPIHMHHMFFPNQPMPFYHIHNSMYACTPKQGQMPCPCKPFVKPIIGG